MTNKFRNIYPKQVLILAIIAMFILSGFSFMWPLTSIYVTNILGKSLTTAGWVLTIEGLSGVIGSFLGGVLFDRFGGKPIMIIASSLVIASNLILAFAKEWTIFLICFILMNTAVGVLMTSISALTGLIWPEGGRKPYNLNYVLQNVGVAFGTALGGFVSSISFSYSFLTNALFFIFASLLMIFGLKNINSKKNTVATEKTSDSLIKTNIRTIIPIGLLGLGASFTMISYIQWQTTIPIFMQDLNISISSYSLLWTINGVLVLVFQPLNSFMNKLLPSNWQQFILGQLCFMLSFVLLELNHSYLVFIISMGLVTLGEIIIWPAIPACASNISPKGRSGLIQGIINIFNYSGRLLGPLFGTSLYQSYGPSTMILVMIAFYLTALLIFLFSFSLSSPKGRKKQQYNPLLASEEIKHIQ